MAKESIAVMTNIKQKLTIDLTFDGGKTTFAKEFDLFGVVKLNKSVVNFFPSKVEIKQHATV
jgi:hypothetical protein